MDRLHFRSLGDQVLRILWVLVVLAGSSWGQSPPSEIPLIAVADFAHGRVPAPGQSESLTVRVTDRAGNPLPGADVLFVAPESGAGGTFPDASSPGARFHRVRTNAQGVATTQVVRNDMSGVYLVDAVVEGTSAAVSFAMTNVSEPNAVALSADDARRLVVEHVLLNTVEDETLRLHGPVLLPALTLVEAAGGGSDMFPSGPTLTAGPTWLFWVDEYPGAGYQHPTRFVLLDATEADPDFATAAIITREMWWPQVTLPDAGAPADLLPPVSTNRAMRNALRAASDITHTIASAIGAAADAAAEDTCVIAISGPEEWALGNSADRMAEFFENDLQIPKANIETYTDSFGWSQPCPPGKLREFLEAAREKGCKKLYLYIACHGNDRRGLVLANGDDSDGYPSKDYLSYEEVGDLLEPLAETETEVCMIIDSCFSGLAIRHVQDRGVTGSIITSADPGGYMRFPISTWSRPDNAWSRPAYFTGALIECWKALLADDEEATGRQAYEWVLEQQEGTDAVNGRPQHATIDPAGGVHPLSDVRVPLPCDTVPVTVRRPAAAVGDNLRVELAIPQPYLASFVERDEEGNLLGQVPVVTRAFEGDEVTVEVHGLATTTYASFVRDENLKEFRGQANIFVGGYRLEDDNTQIEQGQTKTARLRQNPSAERPRPYSVVVRSHGGHVIVTLADAARFRRDEPTVEFELTGMFVSTDRLIVEAPLYGLRGESAVTVTGTPCPGPPSFFDLIGVPSEAVQGLPLGNADCTWLSDLSSCRTPEGPQKICDLHWVIVDVSPEAAETLFEQQLPCGSGPHGLTVCASAEPPGPGRYLIVTVRFEGPIPLADSVHHYQYGFPFDADGQMVNNYFAGPPYVNDWYILCDKAFQVLSTPDEPWRAEILDMRYGDFSALESDARFLISGNELTLIVPMAELPTPAPAGRVTTHCHLGEFGLLGLPWSGDYFPLVGVPLTRYTGPVAQLDGTAEQPETIIVDDFNRGMPAVIVVGGAGGPPVSDGTTVVDGMYGGERDVLGTLLDFIASDDSLTIETDDGHLCVRQDPTVTGQVFVSYDGIDGSGDHLQVTDGLSGVDITAGGVLDCVAFDVRRSDLPLDAAVVVFSNAEDSSELVMPVPVVQPGSGPVKVEFPLPEFTANNAGADFERVTAILLFLGPHGGMTGAQHLEIDDFRVMADE